MGGRPHGMSKLPEYKGWQAMKRRCDNPADQKYARYGGRGITVCERWQRFVNFYADMGPRPSPNHSIDRIDNDGHYEPGNCRWATQSEQMLNTSRNVWLEYDGRRQTITQWAIEFGIALNTLKGRIHSGIPLNAPAADAQANRRDQPRLTLNGRSQTPAQWGRELGIRPNAIVKRLRRGWSAERALTTPITGA